MHKFLFKVGADEKQQRLSKLEDERRAERQQRFADRDAEIAWETWLLNSLFWRKKADARMN
jgi:hypothetical protein